jgi:hypothetical protein
MVSTFLNKNIFPHQQRPFDLIEESKSLTLLLTEKWSPNLIIEQRAIEHSSRCDIKYFSYNVFLFQMLLDGTNVAIDAKYKTRIMEYFKERTAEEWSLLYWEVYFWKCFKGRHHFLALFNAKLFNNEFNIFYTTGILFFNPYRKFKETPIRIHLERLFRKLKMTRITLRKNLPSFKASLLPYYTEKLDERALMWMMKEFEDLDENWFGKWYIFDRGLFVDTLIKILEPHKNFLSMNPDEQKLSADFIFVVVLVALTQKKLKVWADLETFNFLENLSKTPW